MNKNDLHEAIHNVDKEIINEAGKKKSKFKWIAFATPAACILIAVSIVLTVITVNDNGMSNSGKYDDGIIGGISLKDKIEEFIEGASDGIFSKKEMSGELSDAFPKALEDGGYRNGEVITAGTLTAGEWKDLSDISAWVKLINENKWYEVANNRNIFSNKIVKVVVKDGDASCFNVPFDLLSEDETVIYSAKTNVKGEAFLLYNVTKKTENPTSVSVSGTKFNLDGKTEITVDVKDAGTDVKELDLMLMIDTTGSMGDELYYLQLELQDMVSRISKCDETLSIRVSVNFYRDEGDEYVVKYYDFRTNIEDCVNQITQESASGGGDFPEAVHTALDNAVSGHQWRNNAVKLCFIVLDAPPHSAGEVQGVNESLVKSLTKASKEGIRVIPVMCSGADDDTEYTLRSFAVLTGGTFVFLTNDSGIGNPHQETSVGEYEVETLNECMIRIVCEYCGLSYEKPSQQQK